jgi:hypothetical protein
MSLWWWWLGLWALKEVLNLMADIQDNVTKMEDPRILRLSSTTEAEPEVRVPLFYIDDVEYTVLKNPPPTVGLQYLRILKEQGEGFAAYFLLTNLLGEEGYAALENYDKLTREQYDKILELAVEISTGQSERPKVPRRRPGSSGQPRLPG